MSTEAPAGGVSSRHMEKLVGKSDRMLKRSGGSLVDRFGEETAALMRREMLDEYRRLIPEVPYIGGRRNIYFDALAPAPWALAAYRVVVGHGGNLEDAGELLHRMVKAEMERIPKVLRHWIGRQRFGRLRRRKVEKAARRSQARRYPGDWVFERIGGDGKTFDFGIDITECGIVKYLHAQEADELCPYLCDGTARFGKGPIDPFSPLLRRRRHRGHAPRVVSRRVLTFALLGGYLCGKREVFPASPRSPGLTASRQGDPEGTPLPGAGPKKSQGGD